MTTSLKKNPKYITLATEPWCLSPGTFVMIDEETKVEKVEEKNSEEVVAVNGEDDLILDVVDTSRMGNLEIELEL